MVGHARYVSEMIMEAGHRQFKEWMEKNTNMNSHLSGMDRAIGRAWLSRISVLNEIRKHGDEPSCTNASNGLRRLLLGEESFKLLRPPISRITDVSDFLVQCNLRLEEMFKEPVSFMLSSICPANTPYRYVEKDWQYKRWNGQHAMSVDLRKATCRVESVFGDIDVLHSATYSFQLNTVLNKKDFKYDSVRSGDAISTSCTSTEGEFVSHDTGGSFQSFFFVESLFRVKYTGTIYAGARLLMESDGAYTCSGMDLQFVEFGSTTRRIGMVHLCNGYCVINIGKKSVSHGKQAKRIGLYYLLTREDGFPPPLG